MAEQRRVVFDDAVSTDRLPDWARLGGVIIEWLRQHDVWWKATERLKIQREGGYAGIDALLFLLYFFTSSLGVGFKEFSERARPHHNQLAAIGGRAQLPTQSSMSRILSAVDKEQVRDFGCWFLQQAPGLIDVLQHPSVLTRDVQSNGWHFFDWDPTVDTLRHRALPSLEGTPEGRRRSLLLAEPGYSGRKRGDVQLSRSTLQHAGSGLWLGIELAPGNGTLRASFHAALDQVIATCHHASLDQSRAVLRSDGVGGNVPFISACQDKGVHYITRLARYRLLEDVQITRHLDGADWFTVPSSGSGPTRQAADLGMVTLEPAATTRHDDGSPYDPIQTRVVVSRFFGTGDKHGAGVMVGEWQYELYATDLPVAAWPEAEIVTGYYGRTGQENRFGQEDRELKLGRIFSYHLPGQHLATLVGLFVWNFEVCRGMDLSQPPNELPEQCATEAWPVAERPSLAAQDDAHEPDAEPAHAEATAEGSDNKQVEGDVDSGDARQAALTRTEFFETLDDIDWEGPLAAFDDWQWSLADSGLRCPNGEILPFKRIEKIGPRIRARFTADPGTCDVCPLRQSCIRTQAPNYRRDVRLTLPEPHAEPLRRSWLARRASLRDSVRHRTRPPATELRSNRHIGSPKWRPLESLPERSRLAVAPPTLLPAALRKVTRAAARSIELHVRVDLPLPNPKPSPVLAQSPAERQNRRLSWQQRLSWNALSDAAVVTIRYLGAESLRPLLQNAITTEPTERKAP